MPAKIAMKTSQKTLTFIGVVTLLLCFSTTIEAHSVADHNVRINTIGDTFSIEEQIILQQKDNANLTFFVPSDATDISFIINNTDIQATSISENRYNITNYTQGLNQDQTEITITYTQSEETPFTFSKEFVYDTATFTLTFDQKTISSLESINAESTLTIMLPEEQDTKTSLNLYTTILIALLVVLVLVTSAYGIKKRGNGVKRNRDVDSTELLTTEKALLMNVLKEIEKKHRDHKISDETYQKLKTHYKQQTVDIMSSIED